MSSIPICPYCDTTAEPTTGAKIYFGRKDLARLNYWICPPCDAYVGCHQHNKRMGFTGWEPLGRLANAELRAAKQKAHRAFDPIWKDGHKSRGKAYRWLSGKLGITKDECHIGMFDVQTCQTVERLANEYMAYLEFNV